MTTPFEKFQEQIKQNQEKLSKVNLNETDIPKFEPPNFNDLDVTKLKRPRNPTIIPINLDYVFIPKTNITVLELARILGFLQLSISTDSYEKMPPELQRHFMKYAEIIESEKKEE